MKIDMIAELVRTLPLEDFLLRYDGHYLLVGEHSRESTTSFRTGRVDVKPAQAAAPRQGEAAREPGRVHPLRKTAKNAFQNMVSVGRTSNNDIVLEHPSISKLHAFFRPQPDGGYTLTDSGSTCGTTLDAAPLTPHQPVPLQSGQVVVFGNAIRSTYFSATGLYEFIKSLQFFKKL